MLSAAWDDDRNFSGLLRILLRTQRLRLLDAKPERHPALYLLFFGGNSPRLARDEDLAAGSHPIYAGAAEDMAERLNRHVRNLDGARNLRLDDLHLLVMPFTSCASALYAERLVQDRLRPLFCLPALAGLGSRNQGSVRNGGQRPTGFDALHRRRWTATSTPAQKRAAMAAVATYLRDPSRSSGMWPPLVPVTARAA